ncbi:MAG: acyl-CoA thioesterase domain-containing protein [Actinomycetota bacterium]
MSDASADHSPPAPFELLDLRPSTDPTSFRLVALDRLCTPFRFLYGGSGVAASAEAAERATGRPVQWMTTQFLAPPGPGAELDVDVSVMATGRASSQTQVTVTDVATGQPMLTSLAAHNVRATGDERFFAAMPSVDPPEACGDFFEPFAIVEHESFFAHLERRMAAGRLAQDAVDQPDDGPLAIWVRLRDGDIGSAATQAFVADIGPLAACARLGVPPGGTSLDNTLRVVDTAPSEWVLFDMQVDGFARSVAHTTVQVWSEDGRLLGLAQQSAIIRTSHHDRR